MCVCYCHLDFVLLIFYLPIFQNTTSAEDNVRHLVYLLENAILNLPEGQEQMSWLIDFTGFSLNTSVSVKTSREIINILQNHYPERLAVAILYSPPRVFQALWKVWTSALFSFWLSTACILLFL